MFDSVGIIIGKNLSHQLSGANYSLVLLAPVCQRVRLHVNDLDLYPRSGGCDVDAMEINVDPYGSGTICSNVNRMAIKNERHACV